MVFSNFILGTVIHNKVPYIKHSSITPVYLGVCIPPPLPRIPLFSPPWISFLLMTNSHFIFSSWPSANWISILEMASVSWWASKEKCPAGAKSIYSSLFSVLSEKGKSLALGSDDWVIFFEHLENWCFLWRYSTSWMTLLLDHNLCFWGTILGLTRYVQGHAESSRFFALLSCCSECCQCLLTVFLWSTYFCENVGFLWLPLLSFTMRWCILYRKLGLVQVSTLSPQSQPWHDSFESLMRSEPSLFSVE